MDALQAVEARISCRAYTTTPIDPAALEALQAKVEEANRSAGLHFQLYGPRKDGTAIDMSPKMFAGNPPLYAALVAQKGPDPEEKLGYYGEQLVLLATQLGLGTCWVASTYDHDTVRVNLNAGEALHDVVPIGYAPAKIPLIQRTIRSRIRARSKKNRDLFQGPYPLDQAPGWIQAAIQAVQLAPSAVCEQPVVFTQDSPESPIRATLPVVKSGLGYTDLGIAKLHFQLSAEANGHRGAWEWGEGGAFVLE